jgi:hypothetical protein
VEVTSYLHVPSVLPLRETLRFPAGTRLGFSQGDSEHFGEEKNLYLLLELNPDSPMIQLIA